MKKTLTRKYRPKIKGGFSFNYGDVFQKPSWYKGRNNWCTFVKLKNTQVYATSIPSENLYKCLANLSFYMHVKDIKRIISLQGCDIDDGRIAMNCYGRISPLEFDTNYESRMWNEMKGMYKETHENDYIDFKNHKIHDYTAGSLTTWSEIFNYNYYNPNQKTLIHCLAGFGRTGSILLMIFMYNYYNNHSEKRVDLSEPFLGYPTGFDLFMELNAMFFEAIELDTSVENGEVNVDIARFDTANIVKEVFDISDYSHANLCITRINYIRILIGLAFEKSDIFLYQLWPEGTDYNVINCETIFDSERREPVQVPLSEIETISSQVDNPFGITV